MQPCSTLARIQNGRKNRTTSEVTLVSENQSFYIPFGAIHRMEKPGKLPLTLIEVQTGSYFGEYDIVSYQDVYARGQGAKG